MIKNLEVKNFKSIKHLKIDCKRINVFIGKPNTGKSNILESLGVFSLTFSLLHIRSFVRFESMTNLFYDQDIRSKIEISAGNYYSEILYDRQGYYKGRQIDKNKGPFGFEFNLSSGGVGSGGGSRESPFRFYRFQFLHDFKKYDFDYLMPPNGENLLFVLQMDKSLRKIAADIFREYALRLVLKPQESKIEVQKEVEEDVIISYPYSLVSDTLQRIIFHTAAIETNKDSILIFEEPESHAFPFYTKDLAERIADDESNQYFMSTHNPYFLIPLLSKAPKDDIGIFITYFEDYQTKVKPLSQKEKVEILDLEASAFFNLDKFLGEK